MAPKKIGRYEIKSELGRGGMATIYRGWDPLFEREVAIKVLPPELLYYDPQFKLRFEREAKIIAQLEHPSILPVYDVGDDNGQPYFVMRYMSGGSLYDRIKAKNLTIDDAIKILNQLSPGLDEAHAKGIVHRDLKPSNILFDSKGTPYISDFGIARLSQSGSTTGSAIIGTPAYMAPEQAQGTGIDGRTDIYAVGIILFEMLTGTQPYEADTPMAVAFKHITDPIPAIHSINPVLPQGVDKVIGRAMAKNKEERFSTVAELVQMLQMRLEEKGPGKIDKTPTQKLRVFLCHASQDKPAVRELYKRLAAEAWIDPWLDEESLLPGQDFDLEIYKATRDADAIIICLSKVSVVKEGYLNKEIRRVLDIAGEKLEGTIYVIPLRLDDCSPSFERLKQLHWVDYFKPDAHERLVKSLRLRAEMLKIEIFESKVKLVVEAKPDASQDFDLDLYRFIQIPPTEDVPYSFYIGKYPVTNAQYERFVNAPDFTNPVYWLEFSMFDANCKLIGNWERTGVDWLKEQLKQSKSNILFPRNWNDKVFGISNPNYPVVGVSWYEASAYSEWLFQNWDSLPESKANPFAKPREIRLPLETEWVIAAGGKNPPSRYPWDEEGKVTTLLKDILRRSNIDESGVDHTTSVNAYPLGRSPYGVIDMAGNVWEWQANQSDHESWQLGLRGGSWALNSDFARVSFGSLNYPEIQNIFTGFRPVMLF